MIKGWYTAASGMMMQMSRQDVIANNIANAATTGFKKQISISRTFPDMLISRLETTTDSSNLTENIKAIGRLGTGVGLEAIVTDLSVGNLAKTDTPTDFSLVQTGSYFVVETEQGERYTRNGAFKINSEGSLTDSQGNPVLDEDSKPIKISGEFSVDRRGVISFSDGTTAVTLKVMQFNDPGKLERIGDSLYSNENGTAGSSRSSNPDILQGYLEESNVNAIKEMVDLLSVVRAYESLQKVVQAEDEAAGVAIDQVGSTS